MKSTLLQEILIFRHLWTPVLNRQKRLFHITCLYYTSVNILTKRRLKAFKRHHFHLEGEKSELSLHIESLVGLSCFFFWQGLCHLLCPSGIINLAVIQCLALEGYGMSVSCHTCIHSHTESCILSPETEKFQCVQLLVVSSEISERGPPKSLEYENYTSLFFYFFFFFLQIQH